MKLEVSIVGTSTNQAQSEQDQDRVASTPNPARRGMWNWFGAAFGISVLVGASFLYLTARTAPGTEVPETITEPLPTASSPTEQVPDQPPVEQTSDPMPESTTGALLGIHVVSSLEIHELEKAYAEATEVDENHVAQLAQALAALDTVEWPDELSEVAAEFRARVAKLLEALERRDLEEARHSLEAVHEGQHLLWSGVYAWLSGTQMPAHPDEEPAPAEDVEIQVIEIEMYEFGYEPETIDIEAGMPVIFRFTNTGRLPHEAMVGDAHMQEEFSAAGDHDDGQKGADDHGDLMATLVQAGETKDLEVLIDKPGTWYVACHLVGHYEQGQVATINVRG